MPLVECGKCGCQWAADQFVDCPVCGARLGLVHVPCPGTEPLPLLGPALAALAAIGALTILWALRG
jgi:hypothetical protein